MTKSWHSIALHHAGALVFTALAVLLRWLLDPWLGDHLPLATLFGAVALAVWFGGHRPALLAVLFGYLACDYLFIEPRGILLIASTRQWIGLATYLVSCAIIIAFAEAMRSAQGRAETLAAQANTDRERLQVTLASIGDAVITTDATGRITFLNPVAEELTGWPLSQARGHPLTTVFHIVNEHTRTPTENPVARVLAEGRVLGLANHTVLLARDGTEHPIEDSAAPIRDEKGNVTGVVLVFRDVSERRRAEYTHTQLAAIVESSEDAIFSKNLQGIVTSWNKGAERLYGYSAAEIIGKPIVTILPPDRSGELSEIMTRISRGERIETYETVRLRKDGNQVHVSISISPLGQATGKITGASVIARDITLQKRAEAALRDSERVYRAIGESINYGVWVCDPEGRNVYVSESFLRLVGLTQEQCSEFGWVRVLHPDDGEATLAAWKECVRTQGIWDREHRFQGVDGKYHPVLARGVPVRDDRGRVLCWAGINLDISGPRRAEEALRGSEERLRLALEAGRMGVWDWNLRTNQIEWSGHFEPIHGLAPGTFGGTFEAFTQLIHPDDRALVQQAITRAVEERSRYDVEFRIIWPNGSIHWMASKGEVFTDEDRPVRMIGVSMNIDERKHAEEERKQADRRKDEFLATLAHELRNPLAPLRNSLHLLRLAGNDPRVMEQAQGMMERQVQHLIRLVDDLLDVSRITRGKLTLRKEPIDLARVIHSAVETSRPVIEAAGHELIVEFPAEPILVHGDLTRLAQVFANLLTNAAKYTDRGGRIRLTALRQGSAVEVRVEDNGIGIAPEHLPHLFEMFSQVVPALERSQGGLGIGLALVRGLVHMHEGSVEAHSAGPGLGSVFTVRLPVLEGHVAPSSREGIRTNTVHRPPCRILVVDDLLDSAESLSLMLRLLGHEVRIAHDGVEAVQAAEAFQPDVVLLDIGLPGMNGYEVARQIRSQPWGRAVVLVAVTGWGQEEDRRKASAAGFDHHLTKPVDPTALDALLAAVPCDSPSSVSR